jgi:hypothetical protein
VAPIFHGGKRSRRLPFGFNDSSWATALHGVNAYVRSQTKQSTMQTKEKRSKTPHRKNPVEKQLLSHHSTDSDPPERRKPPSEAILQFL